MLQVLGDILPHAILRCQKNWSDKPRKIASRFDNTRVVRLGKNNRRAVFHMLEKLVVERFLDIEHRNLRLDSSHANSAEPQDAKLNL